MKTYEFPFCGSGGPGDTWEGSISIDLSELDYARLEASISSGHDSPMEDDAVSDLCYRVFDSIVEKTLKLEEDMIEEYREIYGMDDDATPREIIEEFLWSQSLSIGYPKALQEKYWEQ